MKVWMYVLTALVLDLWYQSRRGWLHEKFKRPERREDTLRRDHEAWWV